MHDADRGFPEILELLCCSEVLCHIFGVKTANDSAFQRDKGEVEGINQENIFF